MMTREELLQNEEYWAEHKISHKKRLEELGIAFQNSYQAKQKYRTENEKDMFFRFAYMRIGRREDAEDIVQDVFLKLFRSSESLRSVRNIKHYLTRSISNACKDFHGRQQNILQLEKAEREMVADESENVTIEIEDNGCLQQFSLH